MVDSAWAFGKFSKSSLELNPLKICTSWNIIKDASLIKETAWLIRIMVN